jgi:ABC-2 type transport system ATP-binding protein
MAGLLFPATGSCAVSGYVPKKRQVEFLEQIYFVGEEILSPDLKIKEYVKRHLPFYSNFNRDQFDGCLDEFNIGRNEKLKDMSYGTRKKFFLAFGFAVNSPVLILDEPTNGLDIPSKSAFRKILSGIVSENNLVIISTHQVRDLESIIDPIVILDNGKIIFNHSVDEIQNKLLFSTSRDELKGALYSEKVPGGWMNVSECNAQDEGVKITEIQLELLFNAIMKEQKKIMEIFERREALV